MVMLVIMCMLIIIRNVIAYGIGIAGGNIRVCVVLVVKDWLCLPCVSADYLFHVLCVLCWH